MVDYVVKHREMDRAAVDIDQPMSLLGFDSAGFVALGRAMGEWVGKEISPAIVYKYTTIREVAGFLARGADEAELSNPDGDDAIEPDPEGPIAIVGMGLKAPGGSSGNLVGRQALGPGAVLFAAAPQVSRSHQQPQRFQRPAPHTTTHLKKE